MNIIEFLLARITEDEAVARAATSGPWEWEPETGGWGDCGPNLATVAKLPPHPDGSQSPVETIIGSWGHDANGISVEPANALHIARHDPSRVLAECAAKRTIVEKAQRADVAFGQAINPASSAASFAMAEVLQFLARPYADHPDYQQEWATS